MNIALLIALLILSAFFSGSETAFFSLGKIRFKQIEKLNTRTSKRVIKLLSRPTRLIITILIGNTLVNIAISSITSNIIYLHIGDKGIPISILAVLAILLIFGEVTPKMLALAKAKSFSFFASFPLLIFEYIFAPLRNVLNKLSQDVVKLIGIKVKQRPHEITEQEIRYLFSVGKSKGLVKEKEKDMIDNILRFKDRNAADIMTPRINIAALDLEEDKALLSSTVQEHQYSRLPVFMHKLDNIVGIIHSKDFLLNPSKDIRKLLRKPYFVPESMRIDDLLHNLQDWKVHMAIVTDEYGVTSGVVTIEDILEEIVGEIRDEYDFETPLINKVDRKTFEVNGQTHINDINEELAIGVETKEVDTIGGFVVLKLGHIPRSGEYVEINGYRMTVKDVSRNRITSLEITKL